ncbi:MAG: hypothetical protein A2081_04740 [Elusimicrobia bacterium GWC2_61_19]|nr:MAG: hypothetical protein A2081_04740 [Elusimicrobia bacterium GWC2_61_19]
MKIILIAPPYDLMGRGYGTKAKIKYGHMPPLGIGYIAAVLLQLGHDVKIIDAPARGCFDDDVVRETLAWGAEAAGISAMTASADSAYSVASALRAASPMPIIMGGPHSVCFPEKVLADCPAVDISVFGEGETVMAALNGWLADKGSLAGVDGICYRDENGNVVRNKLGESIADLDSIPSPAWHLYDFSLYRSLPGQNRAFPVAPLITSRGCPYRCTFCFQAGNKSARYRRHSPQRIVSEIENLYKNFGIREVMFWDDTFAMNIDWMETFCAGLKAKVRLPWSCYGRVNTVSEKMLKLMAGAGCWNIFYGYETGSQKMLDLIQKGTTIEQCVAATKWARRAGLQIRASFMLALPGETPEMARQTIAFAIQLDPDYVQFLPTYPEYGTVLYEQALKEGKITRGLEYKGRTRAAYVPDGYASAEEVEKMVRYAYRKFYLRFSYVWGRLRTVRKFSDLKAYYDGLKFILGIAFK